MYEERDVSRDDRRKDVVPLIEMGVKHLRAVVSNEMKSFENFSRQARSKTQGCRYSAQNELGSA